MLGLSSMKLFSNEKQLLLILLGFSLFATCNKIGFLASGLEIMAR